MEFNRYAQAIAEGISRFFTVIVMVIVGALCVYGINTAITRKVNIMEAFNPSYVPADVRARHLECLTRNIYWEAAGEPFEGKVAVAQVTLNRSKHPDFPSDVCAVVHQKTKFQERVVCQFSWLCEKNHLTRPVHKKEYDESAVVAKMVLLENFKLDSLNEAIYYHADYVNPGWRKQKITKIGRHIFYRG